MARQDNFITDNMERIEMFRSLQLRLATSAHCLLGFGWTGRELWRHLTAATQAQLACWNTQTAWQYPGETLGKEEGTPWWRGSDPGLACKYFPIQSHLVLRPRFLHASFLAFSLLHGHFHIHLVKLFRAYFMETQEDQLGGRGLAGPLSLICPTRPPSFHQREQPISIFSSLGILFS